MQVEALVALTVEDAVPGGHGVQPPEPFAYVPATQLKQLDAPAFDAVPGEHAVQEVTPADAEYVPAAQGRHCAAPVCGW
jgi:hypothetical protein